MPFKLKLMTYMVPDLPLELFQTYQYYLEESLGIPTSLCVESRQDGPSNNKSPIVDGEADIMFVSSTCFLRLLDGKSPDMELLPVAPIFTHPKSEQRPIYFSEMIIPKSRTEMHKELVDLKGSRFAYDKEGSIAGETTMLDTLKTQGYNATFYGHSTMSGSHRNSIKMVLQGRADVATVDSNAFEFYLREHPEKREELTVMNSLGPLPIYPMVINAKLPAEMKNKLRDLFLSMHTKTTWAEHLMKFNILCFKPIDESLYDMEKNLRGRCEKVNMTPAYY